MPDPEKIRMYNLRALKKAIRVLKRYSRSDLFSLRKALNCWEWHWILGDPPKGWDELPNYRKPWMPAEIITREDYIRPYMGVLDMLGVTHRSMYEKPVEF